MLQALDADALRRWCSAGLDRLSLAREEIDALNVYPVPDGDTGTNLVLTMQSVVAAVSDGAADLPATCAAMTRAALLGARGNSGVILSQLLRGLSDVLSGCPDVTGADLQRALRRAADLGYAAVAQPVEGTVLTVARAAADAAAAADPADLAAVAKASAAGAAEALARTPLQLEALARAGVVDAGGRGLVLLLEALAEVVSGERPSVRHAGHVVARPHGVLEAARETGSDEFGYEVQYLLEAADEEVPALRERLRDLGDSLVVVGGEGLWNVHVHVNDAGAAIEAGVDAGRPRRITVTRFADQYAARPAVAPPPAPADEARIVAVLPGPGLCRLFEAEGALPVGGGPSDNPSTAQVVDAIRAAGADHVVVLPNDPNVRAVADAAAEIARDEGRVVVVIPTKSPVQGIAALAVHDPGRRFEDDVIAMTAAAGATRWAAVTVAVREAQTSVGVCRAGDVLGLIEGDVVVIGGSVHDVAAGLVDRMLIGGGELVTLVVGAGAEDGLGERLAAYVEAVRPAVEVQVCDGGQPHYPLLVGVE